MLTCTGCGAAGRGTNDMKHETTCGNHPLWNMQATNAMPPPRSPIVGTATIGAPVPSPAFTAIEVEAARFLVDCYAESPRSLRMPSEQAAVTVARALLRVAGES